MNIEVKHLLGRVETENQKSSADCLKIQLQECKSYIEEWFGTDLSSNWKFISLAFCEKLEEGFDFCNDTCNKFVVCGIDDLHGSLDSIIDSLNMMRPEFDKHSEDFKTLAAYLMFASPVVQLPVSGKYYVCKYSTN